MGNVQLDESCIVEATEELGMWAVRGRALEYVRSEGVAGGEVGTWICWIGGKRLGLGVDVGGRGVSIRAGLGASLSSGGWARGSRMAWHDDDGVVDRCEIVLLLFA